MSIVNRYLFNSDVTDLVELLNQNYNIEDRNLLKIIDANFYNQGNKPRKMFKDTV